jgi:hypothetical protein
VIRARSFKDKKGQRMNKKQRMSGKPVDTNKQNSGTDSHHHSLLFIYSLPSFMPGLSLKDP